MELAEAGHLPSTCVPRWSRERERIAAWVGEHCWSEKKRAYTFLAGTERLDASRGAWRPASALPRRTACRRRCDAVRGELGHRPLLWSRSPWLYRYSGAEKEEGAFLACTFWLAEAYAELGRRGRGARP